MTVLPTKRGTWRPDGAQFEGQLPTGSFSSTRSEPEPYKLFQNSFGDFKCVSAPFRGKPWANAQGRLLWHQRCQIVPRTAGVPPASSRQSVAGGTPAVRLGTQSRWDWANAPRRFFCSRSCRSRIHELRQSINRRISSSISSGSATVWAISDFKISRYRRRSRCAATIAVPSETPS